MSLPPAKARRQAGSRDLVSKKARKQGKPNTNQAQMCWHQILAKPVSEIPETTLMPVKS